MPKRNILLIDDDHRERHKYCEDLEAWGYNVITAYDGTDAVKKMKENDFNLVISDYEMESMSGLELISCTKSVNEDAQVLFMTKTASVENAVTAIKAGAVDFMVKPVDQVQVKLCLEKIFSQNGNSDQSKGMSGSNYQIISNNNNMLKLIELVQQVSDSTASVFIQGESGTGKELFARFIHQNSRRKSGPFIAVNCAALPESLLESELFGYEKGAFTGAVSKKPGKFELADGGTILLDEVTEMAYHLQSKLLRIIQEREVDRVGGIRPIKVDVRIIATSNRNIHKAIDEGSFREDLFYRLNIIPVKIPALRERPEDVELLAHYFIEKYNTIDGRNVKTLTRAALDLLQRLPFKGNVRELENIVQRAVLLSDGECIHERNLFLGDADTGSTTPSGDNGNPSSGELVPGPLREVEKQLIFQTLDKTKGNRTHAAKILGISVRTLRNKLNEYKEKVEQF